MVVKKQYLINQKSKIKKQNHNPKTSQLLFFLAVIMLAANIFAISLHSVNRELISSWNNFVVHLNMPSQYFVSLADFNAIVKNLIKSRLELEDLASNILAPIEVADLNN